MHPDRRREGRRIRKQNRLIIEMLRSSKGEPSPYQQFESQITAFVEALMVVLPQIVERFHEAYMQMLMCEDCRLGYHEACDPMSGCFCTEPHGVQADYTLIR